MGSLRRHLRFVIAVGLGLAAWVATGVTALDPVLRILVAANACFAVYLALMVRLMSVTSPGDLRRHAETDDEGWPIILCLASAAVALSITAIFLVLNRETGSPVVALFALAAAPLGWALLHMLLAYRYAHLYFAGKSHPGLAFPQIGPASEPGIWDFLYVAFTIGMTAQVSDVTVTTVQMRKVVLLHGTLSFFYNTVILALAVNAGLALSR